MSNAQRNSPTAPGPKDNRTGKPLKRIHLGAHFPGVNNTTVWSDPRSGSHIDFASFAHLARTAERAKFDFLFLAEGLRLREQHGRVYDLDVVGRPDTFTVLAALAAVTERLGLTGTINSTFNEPYEVARQFASLDHLSAGRAAWNVVTSWDAFTGENFRRGGFLPRDQRYERARTFLHTTWELFDSWRGDEIVADKETGTFLADPEAGRFAHDDAHFTISGRFNVPRAPQGRPVVFQAGDSDEGREFAASSADAIFSRYAELEEGQAFYRDVKGRLARHGRTHDDLKILPAATFVLGDTDAEAAERSYAVSRQQVSGRTAIAFLERIWNRDLSDHDPDGPLPSVDPYLGETELSQGRAGTVSGQEALRRAAEWRELAEAKKLSSRELVELFGRHSFVGSPATVAGKIDELVQNDAADGVILVPHITPGGLDEFADTVVPLLQERGVFRTEYEGETLRDHLGLRPPRRSGRAPERSGPPHEVQRTGPYVRSLRQVVTTGRDDRS
ncbi:NtaA/DmoA family FMN-dependent monooxygenase [Streptomycetaceae bacterium NBC_01309]